LIKVPLLFKNFKNSNTKGLVKGLLELAKKYHF